MACFERRALRNLLDKINPLMQDLPSLMPPLIIVHVIKHEEKNDTLKALYAEHEMQCNEMANFIS